MLEKLLRIRKNDMLGMIAEGQEAWNSLDVDYEPPRVERLWRQLGEDRLYMHCIHPCEKALLHPHQWPSSILIVRGEQEMVVAMPSPGSLSTDDAVVVSTFLLREGSGYEMLNQLAMHSVRPVGGPSLSLMLTAPPFRSQIYDHTEFGKAGGHAQLPVGRKKELLREFELALAGGASGEQAP
jgi:hypothetical protein